MEAEYQAAIIWAFGPDVEAKSFLLISVQTYLSPKDPFAIPIEKAKLTIDELRVTPCYSPDANCG